MRDEVLTSEGSSVHFFELKNRTFAYEVNSTACYLIDKFALSLLPDLAIGNSEGLIEKYKGTHPKEEVLSCIDDCMRLLTPSRISKQSALYRHQIQKNILALSLNVSHQCNLNCRYCYAGAGSFGREACLMSSETARKAIDFAFANSGKNEKINISFFGGEPLLNFRVIAEGVDYAKNSASNTGKRVSFSMTTNAIKLNTDIMEFLYSEKFSLIFSIDGPQNIHNRMRKYKNGRGTHSDVLKNIKHYQKHYSEDFTVRGTFTGVTSNFCEQVTFLNDQGFKNISVEPAQLHDAHPYAITSEIQIARIRDEYDKLAKIYIKRFEEGAPLRFFHFDNAIRKLIKPQPMHTQCGAGGGLITVTPDGKIFPCFEMVAEEQNCIGNLDCGFYEEKRLDFQRIHADYRQKCHNCWIKYFCGGGCSAFDIRFNDINTPYEPYCEFAKYRLMLSAWILSEIIEKGPNEVYKIMRHVRLD